jgi:hypothetical protein
MTIEKFKNVRDLVVPCVWGLDHANAAELNDARRIEVPQLCLHPVAGRIRGFKPPSQNAELMLSRTFTIRESRLIARENPSPKCEMRLQCLPIS